MLASGPDILRVSVEALNDVTIACTQCGCKTSVATADMDDDTALYTRCVQDSPRLLLDTLSLYRGGRK
jgi:hypothetical protein